MNIRPNDTQPEQHILLTLEFDYALTLSRALKRLGVEPELGDGGCALAVTPEGVPVPVAFDLPVTLPDGGDPARLVLRGVGEPQKSFTTSLLLELDLIVSRESLDQGRAYFASLFALISEERRMECRASEHFLGSPPDVEWCQRIWPRWRIVPLHQAIDSVFEGWTRVRIGSPRGRAPVRELFVDEEDRRTSLYVEVRYFLRKGDAWLVFDMSSNHSHIEVKTAAVGLENGATAGTLLERIDDELERISPAKHRCMTPSGEELRLEREYSWEDLYLAPALKRELQREVDWFFAHRELYQQMKLPYRRGLLVHGVPGTGKTLFGKVIASLHREVAFIWVTARDVTRVSSVHHIFQQARRRGRTILFFEDLDFYASQRSGAGRDDVLGELLVQLDGMHSNDGLFVIATTNDLAAIEPAIRDRPSRFDRTLELVPAPEDVRVSHLHRLLEPFGVDRALLEPVGSQTEGFTGAQLQELALVARRRALERGAATVTAADLDGAIRAAREFKVRVIGFEPASRREVDFSEEFGSTFDPD